MRAAGLSEATDELYALANRSNFVAYSYSGAIINGVKFLVEQRDIRRTTQNNGVLVHGVGGQKFYGVLQDVIELCYLKEYTVLIFKCKWFDTDPRRKNIQEDTRFTSINTGSEWYKNDPFILASQAKLIYYLDDIKNGPMWKLVQTYAPRLDNKFEYEKTNVVMAEVERLAMKAIREGRCKMRKHWKQLGGIQNKDAPKRKPYKGVSQDDWDVLCDYFGTKKQMEISEKILLTGSLGHLREPMDQKLWFNIIMMVLILLGELPSVIDTFEQLFHRGGQWKNDWAAQKHAQMIEFRSTQQESEVSVSAVDIMQDIDIMTQVLGSRSRYVKGLGPLPKLSVVGGSRAINLRSTCHGDSEKISTMQKTIDEQKQIIDEQHKKFEALLQQLQQVIPGFSFQPPPT